MSDVLARQPIDNEADQPVTLHRVMQTAIAEGLKERYKPPRKMSHDLFVLMLQINDRQAKAKVR